MITRCFDLSFVLDNRHFSPIESPVHINLSPEELQSDIDKRTKQNDVVLATGKTISFNLQNYLCVNLFTSKHNLH